MTIQEKAFTFPLKSWEKTDAAAKFAVTASVSFAERPISHSFLSLQYEILGPIHELVLPAATKTARVDELWRKTCFEIFLTGPDESYFEFNLSPSSEWAFYRFPRYRSAAERPGTMDPRQLPSVVEASRARFTFEVQLPDIAADTGLGLTTVLEHASGERTHWALAHIADRPDFHQRASFKILLQNLQKGS